MSIEIKDLENIDKTEINISDLSSNEIEMIKLNGLINIPLIKGDKGDTGKDGYTPIKGIDYFDGQNGINGEDGKDGTDGQDGYTPIKGKDYFTEEEIQEIKSNILDQVNQFSILVVSKLPTENIDDHTIYFVPKTKAEQDDVYDEYIYINNGWEHIGTTEVDLSSYYKKDEIDKKLSEVEGNEVYIGKAEEAPETAKIIVEDEDFGEGAGLSKAEVYVGTEEPVAGEKVWFRKGKNLFNKDEAVKAHMFVDITNNKFVDNYEQAISTFIKIEGNTTYTISKTAGKTFRIATSKNMPVNSGEILSTTVNHEGTEITITTEPDAKYLFINYYNASNGDTIGEEKMKDSLQVEINTVATPYEDYVEPRIYIRNSNGVYEEFIKKHEEVYSTEEQRIGTWFGKPLYRKVISSTLPKVTTENVEAKKTVSIDADIGTGFIETAYCNKDNQMVPMPFIFTSGQVIKSYIDLNGTIILSSNTTYTNEQPVTIIVCYTKTTD